MAKSLVQIVQELSVSVADLATRVDKLEKRFHTLAKEVEGIQAAPTPRRDAKVPQTPLPATLDKLGIGKAPKGT